METCARYVKGSPTDDLHEIWEDAVASLNKAYSIPADKFYSLINGEGSVVFCFTERNETLGFALIYYMRVGIKGDPAAQHYRGGLAAIAVTPSRQREGIGMTLHDDAMRFLKDKIWKSLKMSTPLAESSVIQLGSTFPRIFPGVPTVLPSRPWFEKMGWKIKENTEIDLYGRIPTGVNQDSWRRQAHKNGVSFRPAKIDDEKQLMALQKANFAKIPGWPDMFTRLFRAGRADDIHLAIWKGKIIGATIAAMPGSPMTNMLAWPDTLGEKCASIACVGISKEARGKGAGEGLVAAAIQELERKGADGVFIDWVSLKGFYERFGVKQWESPYWLAEQ